jgi:cytochrome c55X
MLIACSAQAENGPELQRQQQLQQMVLHDCGACHGMSLKGGLGPALTPAMLEGKSDDLLVEVILGGRENTAMPPWNSLLNASEATWIVKQLKSGAIGAK